MRITKPVRQTDSEKKIFFTAELRRVGLVATQPRIKILSIFHSTSDSKLTVFDVYNILLKQQANIALSTIYKTLHHLSEAGVLRSRQLQDNTKLYELNRGHNLCYIVCPECGNHQDFFNAQLMALCQEQIEESGFTSEKMTLSISSICKNCLS